MAQGESLAGRRSKWGAMVVAVVVVIALGGWGLRQWPTPTPQPVAPVVVVAKKPIPPEVHERFQQGVTMLHAGNYQMAMVAFHRVLQLAPNMAEAHVNLGFALLGLQEYKAATDFFLGAVDLRPTQANAYYGMAMALEGVKDLEGALGAMRSYIHLTKSEDPYLPKARATLREWEGQLGRNALEPLRKIKP